MLDLDVYQRLKRGPQVITLKDAAFISAFTGMQAGDRVLEAGAGSGFLTVYLAGIVGDKGRLYSCDRREEFLKIVEKNLSKFPELQKRVELKLLDVFEKIDEINLDVIVLDMAESEKALENSLNSLRNGGKLCSYIPNVEQVKSFVLAAEKLGFKHLQTIEVIARPWLIREQGCRPETRNLLNHTGFLAFLRK